MCIVLKLAIRAALLCSLLAPHAQFASAEDNQPATSAGNETEMPSADALKNCAFVTHDCELCIITENHDVICSSAGFACGPKTWRCLKASVNPAQ